MNVVRLLLVMVKMLLVVLLMVLHMLHRRIHSWLRWVLALVVCWWHRHRHGHSRLGMRVS